MRRATAATTSARATPALTGQLELSADGATTGRANQHAGSHGKAQRGGSFLVPKRFGRRSPGLRELAALTAGTRPRWATGSEAVKDGSRPHL